MKRQHRWFNFSLLVILASLILSRAACSAQLVPPGDFKGKSLVQWGMDYGEWSLRTEFGDQILPNTVNGVRYLPHTLPGHDRVVHVTVPQGTALLATPFWTFGERYDDGTEDNPADPFLNTVFAAATIRHTFNGNVVLDGPVNAFPERKYGISVFPQPIVYANPEPRSGSVNAIAAIFQGGTAVIYDMLPLGNHTIREEFNSSLFGPDFITYNITVVPEPATGLVGIVSVLYLAGTFARSVPARERSFN